LWNHTCRVFLKWGIWGNLKSGTILSNGVDFKECGHVISTDSVVDEI
jgi:hypothetical protein